VLKIIDAGVMIGDEGFYLVRWNGSSEDSEFVLSGEEVHD